MPQGQTSSSFLSLIFPIIMIYIIFYFMMIRPQRKKEKEHREMLSGLNKNDEIVTVGGIHGTIVNVKDKTIIVRVDDNVKIELEKTSVSYLTSLQKPA